MVGGPTVMGSTGADTGVEAGVFAFDLVLDFDLWLEDLLNENLVRRGNQYHGSR